MRTILLKKYGHTNVTVMTKNWNFTWKCHRGDKKKSELQYIFGIFKFEGERMNRITDKAVKKWIDSFLEMVNKKYSPEKILIFGSRARGDYLIDRDVDMKIFK